MKKIPFLLVFVSLMFLSCAEEAKIQIPLPKSGTQQTPTGGSAPAIIVLNLDPANLTFGGTSSVTAEVYGPSEPSGALGPLVPDGTIVTFILSNPSLGTITPLVTTFGGKATALFTARKTTAGETTITANAGSATSNGTMIVTAPANGSIEFSSASPKVIGIKGSGQTETSSVTFIAKDAQGNPVSDGVKVVFTLNGPKGGEYIGTSTTGVNTAGNATSTESATSDGGKATVILNSGKVSGPVTITATIKNTKLSSSSPTISIGGGVVSGPHFNLAANRLNLPGLIRSDAQSTIFAYVADRFGNFNVLEGTSISFYTEAGAIDRSGITDKNGKASVQLRTQNPDPVLAASPSPDPKNGHVTVIATVMGEEGFDDTNGNGVYDLIGANGQPEPFDDLPEPFIDSNDNNVRDSGPVGSLFEFEEFIDSNGDGQYSPKNGLWDGPGCPQKSLGCQESKMIFVRHKLAFTSGPGSAGLGLCTINPSSFSANLIGQFFTFTLGDINKNILVPGTTISVTATEGTLGGTENFTLADGVGGPISIGFILSETSASSTLSVVTVEVKGAEGVGDCVAIASGTI